MSKAKFKKGDRFVLVRPDANDLSQGLQKGDTGTIDENESEVPMVKMDRFEKRLLALDQGQLDPLQESDAEGWIEWKGGRHPIPLDTLISVKYKDGSIDRGHADDFEFDWEDSQAGLEVIAYKMITTTAADSLGAMLDERGKRYGKFCQHAQISQALKNVMSEYSRVTLADDQAEALEMIAHKIARILNGDPNYADSWADIAGYARLVSDRLEGVER